MRARPIAERVEQHRRQRVHAADRLAARSQSEPEAVPLETIEDRFAARDDVDGNVPGRPFAADRRGRFVIAQVLGRRVDKSHPNATRFVMGDVTSGKVLGQWETPGHFEPLDLSPDGTRFVAKSMPWADGTLTTFAVSPDFKLSRRTIVAHERAVVNPQDTPTRSEGAMRRTLSTGIAREGRWTPSARAASATSTRSLTKSRAPCANVISRSWLAA